MQGAFMATTILPPGPKRKPLVGNLFDFRRNPPQFLLDAASQHGDVVYIKLGPQDVFLVNDPDLIRDVLVTDNKNFIKSRGLQMAKRFLGEGLLTSEGEVHRRQRPLAHAAFHRQRIAAYAEAMVNYAQRMRDGWRDGETLNIAEAMMRLTLSIVAKTLFDAEVESEASEIGAALTAIMKTFNRITNPFAAIIADRKSTRLN